MSQNRSEANGLTMLGASLVPISVFSISVFNAAQGRQLTSKESTNLVLGMLLGELRPLVMGFFAAAVLSVVPEGPVHDTLDTIARTVLSLYLLEGIANILGVPLAMYLKSRAI